jgi:hypothetical protein
MKYICTPMKQCILLIYILLGHYAGNISYAQDPLPEFKLKMINSNKLLISWHNPFKNCVKLSVQRSGDNKNFKTIVTAKNPKLYENSFTDTKLPKNKTSFYRIQYTLKNGKTYFSLIHSTQEKEPQKNTVSNTTAPVWKASPFVFTNRNGEIQILVNNPSQFVYKVLFLEENGAELFQIKRIDTDNLILDKTNFVHSGWFQFELYKDDVLLEKNTIYLKQLK